MSTSHDPASHDESVPVWRTASRGRCFAYLLPARDADIVKVGFSRDPLQRMRSLHERYFDYFDLERAVLVEVDYVREARSVEAFLKKELADGATWAPLVIRSAAGGRTEWFRGVGDRAAQTISSHAKSCGFVFHGCLRTWLHERWSAQVDALFDSTLHAFRGIEFLHHNGDAGLAKRQARMLTNLLDACEAVGLDLSERIAGPVLDWHRNGFF